MRKSKDVGQVASVSQCSLCWLAMVFHLSLSLHRQALMNPLFPVSDVVINAIMMMMIIISVSFFFTIVFQFIVRVLRNGPDKNDSNNGNEHVGIQLVCKKVITFLLSVLTSDWLKQQKLTKLHKSSIIFILTFQPSSIFHLVSV